MFACQLVKRRIQFARLELLAGLYFLPAFPPVGAGVGEHVLRHLLGLALLRTFLALILEF
jgi:hypothetical protein